MRLTPSIIDKIKSAVESSFGPVEVYLFGSRVDDSKKGGDIDLAIKSDHHMSREEFRKHKVKFIAYMTKIGFDFPIDLVNYNTKDALLKNQILHNGEKIF